jgi:hypothetical protein
MKSDKKREEIKRAKDIETLKQRRVAMWKHYHTLPDSDPKKEEVKQAAMGLYDGLKQVGAL